MRQLPRSRRADRSKYPARLRFACRSCQTDPQRAVLCHNADAAIRIATDLPGHSCREVHLLVPLESVKQTHQSSYCTLRTRPTSCRWRLAPTRSGSTARALCRAGFRLVVVGGSPPANWWSPRRGERTRRPGTSRAPNWLLMVVSLGCGREYWRTSCKLHCRRASQSNGIRVERISVPG